MIRCGNITRWIRKPRIAAIAKVMVNDRAPLSKKCKKTATALEADKRSVRNPVN